MSKVVYRGVAYDTEDAKKEYRHWYSETHSPAHKKNVYRGTPYRPCTNWNWEESK